MLERFIGVTRADESIAEFNRRQLQPIALDEAPEPALVRHIVENPMLNGEVIRLDGALRMAAK